MDKAAWQRIGNPLGGRPANRGEGGFSLIELVITVALIVCLAGAGFIAFSGLIAGSEDAKEKAEAGSATTAPVEVDTPRVEAPAVTATPVDLTMLWWTLGGLGTLVVLLLLGLFLTTVINRSRHSALALREKRAELEEDRRKALEIWQKSVDLHGRLTEKVLEVEMDWDMLFSYPVLSDLTVPQVGAFHRALRAADSLSAEAPAGLNLSMEINGLPYPKLVAAADEAWQIAWSYARATGTKNLPRDERRRIDQILQLLKLARSSGGSEHERSLAYGRAERLIGELRFVRVPERALEILGAESRLMLESLSGAPTAGERSSQSESSL